MISFDQVEQWFEYFSKAVPLEVFTFVGSFIEEIIGIIPSPLILVAAGTVSLSSGQGILYLLLLGVMASLGKTLAGLLLYYVADKAEDVVVGKFGAVLGVSHSTIEKLGEKFGKGSRDDWVIFLTRAIPIFPSAAVSVVCGAIRINLKTYIVMSLLGNFVRSMIYLYIGYVGLAQAEEALTGFDDAASLFKVVIVVVVIAGLAWYVIHKRKQVS